MKFSSAKELSKQGPVFDPAPTKTRAAERRKKQLLPQSSRVRSKWHPATEEGKQKEPHPPRSGSLRLHALGSQQAASKKKERKKKKKNNNKKKKKEKKKKKKKTNRNNNKKKKKPKKK